MKDNEQDGGVKSLLLSYKRCRLPPFPAARTKAVTKRVVRWLPDNIVNTITITHLLVVGVHCLFTRMFQEEEAEIPGGEDFFHPFMACQARSVMQASIREYLNIILHFTFIISTVTHSTVSMCLSN